MFVKSLKGSKGKLDAKIDLFHIFTIFEVVNTRLADLRS